MLDINDVLEKVKIWAKETGCIQKDYFGKGLLSVNTKSTDIDLVTEVDRLSDNHIITAIKNSYPDHAILSEEHGQHLSDSQYMWVIDPLDGTINFAHGFPLFTVSIALQQNQQTILGVVYAPMLEQMFYAVKGQGAYLNGKTISVSTTRTLNRCILASGFPYDRALTDDNNADYFAKMVPKVRGLRRSGSAAFDLAYVAAGVFDGYWELNLNLWDVAAGCLLVEEAGGKVLPWPAKRGIALIAGNPAISLCILEHLKST